MVSKSLLLYSAEQNYTGKWWFQFCVNYPFNVHCVESISKALLINNKYSMNKITLHMTFTVYWRKFWLHTLHTLHWITCLHINPSLKCLEWWAPGWPLSQPARHSEHCPPCSINDWRSHSITVHFVFKRWKVYVQTDSMLHHLYQDLSVERYLLICAGWNFKDVTDTINNGCGGL